MLNNNRLILNSVLAFSILSLTIAYFVQYILDHKPCNLCLIERIPYIASIILISLVTLNSGILSGIDLLTNILSKLISALEAASSSW